MSDPPSPLLRREGTTPSGRRFRIRPTVADDLGALLGLHDAVAAEGGLIAAEPGSRSLLEEDLTLVGLLTQGGLSLTLEVDGAVAGRVMAHRPPGAPDSAELAVIVGAAFRGQGLGRALMEVALAWARAVRVRRVELDVFAGNHPAVALYRSLGFADSGAAVPPVEVGGRVHEVRRMVLPLAVPPGG